MWRLTIGKYIRRTSSNCRLCNGSAGIGSCSDVVRTLIQRCWCSINRSALSIGTNHNVGMWLAQVLPLELFAGRWMTGITRDAYPLAGRSNTRYWLHFNSASSSPFTRPQPAFEHRNITRDSRQHYALILRSAWRRLLVQRRNRSPENQTNPDTSHGFKSYSNTQPVRTLNLEP